MGTRIDSRINDYVEAVRALRGLQRAQKDEPQVDRSSALNLAKSAVRHTEALLSGGALAKARRKLSGAP